MKKLVFTFKRIDHPAQDLAVKFHGFLMEQLDSDYVDYLHQQQTNPYYQQTAAEYHFHIVLKENTDNAYGYHGD